MDQAEEIAFVRRLVRMDGKAWERFCREFSAPLLTFVQLRLGCGREAAEEVVQMSFVRCVKSIRSFDPARGRLLPWLKAISRNEAHTLLPAAQVRPGMTSDPSLDVSRQIRETWDETPLPEEILARQETRQLVQEAMMELPSRHREALALKYLESRRVSEIAGLLGQSEKTVESLLTRSREAFRQAFLKLLHSDESEGE
jgi:RNA polymerase sigma-70 factor (ECF subfamily)